MNIPKIKKTVRSFLLGEEGKISKTSLVKLGVIATSLVGISSLNSKEATACHGSTHKNMGCFSGANNKPDDLPKNWHWGCHASSHTHAGHGSSNCKVDGICHKNIITPHDETSQQSEFGRSMPGWVYFAHQNRTQHKNAHGSTGCYSIVS
jgi:hypothetical protein